MLKDYRNAIFVEEANVVEPHAFEEGQFVLRVDAPK